jgi:hypothetical protein
MHKAERDIRDLVKRSGLTLVGLGRTGTGHYRVRVGDGRGREASFTFAATASDYRALENGRATLRRWAREGGAESPAR